VESEAQAVVRSRAAPGHVWRDPFFPLSSERASLSFVCPSSFPSAFTNRLSLFHGFHEYATWK
jgi:hypothetical protein